MTKPSAEQNRQAVKKYYDANKEAINKQRILRKIDEGKTVRCSTLQKYNIDISCKTVLDQNIDDLEKKAVAKHGNKQTASSSPDPSSLPQPSAGLQRNSDNADVGDRNIKVSLKEVLDAFESSTYKSTTKKLYKSRFVQILTWADGDSKDVVKSLRNIKRVENRLLKHTKQPKDHLNVISTMCNKKNMLPSFCKAMGAKLIKQYTDRMSFYLKKGTIQSIDRGSDDVINYNKIKDALTTIEKESKNSQDHLIIALYNYNAWRDDIGHIVIWKAQGSPPDDGKNYYHKRQNTIYLRDYKTSRKYGEKRFKLTTYTKNIINAQIQNNPDKIYLVSKPDGSMYAQGKISAIVTKAFKAAGLDGITINTIRHSKVTSIWSKKTSTSKQKIDLADRMMHELETAKLIYERKEEDD